MKNELRPTPINHCKCGCGKIVKSGNQYLYGHTFRKLSAEAIAKRTETQRQQRMINEFKNKFPIKIMDEDPRPIVITIKSGATGYEEALKKVLDIRVQKKKLYGDENWKNMPDWENLAMIKQKVRKLEQIIVGKNPDSAVKALIDLTNYSLFMLQNKIDKK